jgi:hypothetical protein
MHIVRGRKLLTAWNWCQGKHVYLVILVCREHVFKGNKRAGNVHLEIKCARNKSLRNKFAGNRSLGNNCAGNIYLGVKCAGNRYVLGVREQELRDYRAGI